jgi:hypothetical protein
VKIPDGPKKSDKLKRLDFCLDLIERCRVSRVERRQEYTSRRFFWLYGTDGSYENMDTDLGLGPPPGNKIWPHIDQLTSFLYAQDTTRFATELGAKVPKELQTWVPKLNEEVNDEWHNSNTDILYGSALALALVYDCTFIKPTWRKNGIYPGVVLPHNMGVLREDVGMLSRQEAFCHWYTITPSQFRNDYGNLPRFDSIFTHVAKRASGIVEAQEAGLDRIIMSSQDPLGTGGGSPNGVAVVDWLSQVSMNYVPRVREELIELTELYVWDDAIGDFRVFTIADPAVSIFDRPLKDCGGLAHETGFIQVCPNPDPHYFWGISEVERLTPLQVYRNRCLAQIDHLQDLQAHPPSTSSGFPSDLLELQYVLDSPNGFLNNPDPSGIGGGGPRAERIKIEIPSDLYERIDRIDQMFEDMSGLPPVTQGKNPPGVRAGGHASELAKLGSSRARKRAMIVEDSLEALATLYLKFKMKYDPTVLEAPIDPAKPEQTEKFVADQFTDDFTVKVDAHSNSPIFVDDQTALAFQLFKAKAITRKRLLQMVPVSQRQQLIYDLEHEIEPAEKAAAEAQQKIEMQRAQAHPGGRPKKNGAGAQPPQQ